VIIAQAFATAQEAILILQAEGAKAARDSAMAKADLDKLIELAGGTAQPPPIAPTAGSD
jgi:hypothetical protein